MAELLRAGVLAQVPHAFVDRATAPDPARADPALIVPGGRLVKVRQVHSALALAADAPFVPGAEPEADALATATPGLVLGIVTADCAPVLLADRDAGVIGAAHAGWRGAFGGVIAATVERMEALGAVRGRIAAAIGPTIARASYEVDSGFRDRFVQADGGNDRFFQAGVAGHWQFDLPAYVAGRLHQAGVGQVEDLARDTYADAVRYFSFRRATHLGQPDNGRQMALIGLGR